MQSHTKYARLSRQALISQHGQALQDSGFTKLDWDQTLSRSSEPTTTNALGALCYQSRTVTGRLYSGRPAIQTIHRAGLSTSVHQFREIASMYSTEELICAMRSALQKTYSPPSRSESQERLSAMVSWGPRWGNTRLHSFLDAAYPYYSGSIQTQQAKLPGSQSLSNLDLSDLELRIYAQLKTPSAIAFLKLET